MEELKREIERYVRKYGTKTTSIILKDLSSGLKTKERDAVWDMADDLERLFEIWQFGKL